MYSRWDIWFNNPPEPDYTASSLPTRVLLTFGNEDGMTRNISWQCDSTLHDSKVELLDETDKRVEMTEAEPEEILEAEAVEPETEAVTLSPLKTT